MKKYLLYILLSSISIAAQTQNLVPNWSFEDTVSCPTGQNQINLAVGWSAFRNSPDYFHVCNNSFQSVPTNQFGYQYPKTGEAYAGLITYHTIAPNLREFIGVNLIQSLDSGITYYISFYTAMAFNMQNSVFGIASDKLGIKFSTQSFSSSNPADIDNFSHIYSNVVNTDTLNWTKISGSFIADSMYNFIIIGNFFDDFQTSTIKLDPSAVYSYYYVDDIRISTDSAFVNSINSYQSPTLIKVFPNPARDWITIEGHDIAALFLFDVLGNKVYENNSSVMSPHKISVEKLASGTYFLIANIKENIIRKKIIVIN